MEIQGGREEKRKSGKAEKRKGGKEEKKAGYVYKGCKTWSCTPHQISFLLSPADLPPREFVHVQSCTHLELASSKAMPKSKHSKTTGRMVSGPRS